ncbi:Uncharacterized protein APZ42_028192 [Daphnia magna]|uniref:Uncharacterized protein n=1 Tax=Daphnia magna TaxID=35525 RepID=A0A164QJP3_9CRUS|nr:Uncharacterized protein APZ42_028192 [Daphnia magna]
MLQRHPSSMDQRTWTGNPTSASAVRSTEAINHRNMWGGNDPKSLMEKPPNKKEEEDCSSTSPKWQT